MLKNLLVGVIILFFASFLQVAKAEASKGIVELGSVNGSAARCFAISTLLNRSTNYLVLIQCRNLIYPVEPAGSYYILWSNPIGLGKDSKPVLIGDLGFGEGSFNIQNSFSSLFITKEQILSPTQPSNNRVMEGRVKPIPFLEREPTPTIIPTPTIKSSTTTGPTPEITQIVTPTPQPKGSGILSTVIQAVGILIIGIFIFASIFFVISKMRRS